MKKGGIGGVAMFIAGYIALSYLWEYDHISKYYKYWRICNDVSFTIVLLSKFSVTYEVFSVLVPQQSTTGGGSTTKTNLSSAAVSPHLSAFCV